MAKETVFKERAQKVFASMKENGMDQLIVSDPASINYLNGSGNPTWDIWSVR